jgi:S-ribosylhomocysteine lyase
MEKIAFFTKDHNKLNEGLYISTQMQGVTTFDLRFKKPNTVFLSTAVAHTIEHLLATTLRNSNQKDNIIYFGPMGCRTGFYLLTINLDKKEVKTLLIDNIQKSLLINIIPGNKKEECGNYLDHDLDGAKKELNNYLKFLGEI